MAGANLFAHTAHMAKPPHYIRQWRKHRGLTLEQLAERLHMTHQNLGKIERFKVPYNQVLLERLAEELRTEAASLIMRDPTATSDVWSIYERLQGIDPSGLRVIEATVDALKKTGTDN